MNEAIAECEADNMEREMGECNYRWVVREGLSLRLENEKQQALLGQDQDQAEVSQATSLG